MQHLVRRRIELTVYFRNLRTAVTTGHIQPLTTVLITMKHLNDVCGTQCLIACFLARTDKKGNPI